MKYMMGYCGVEGKESDLRLTFDCEKPVYTIRVLIQLIF